MVEKVDLLKAEVQTKRIYTLLNEVMDLSRQLAGALDRNDAVTIRMLVSMRREPLEKVLRARQILEEQREALNGEVGDRLAELLNGEPARTEEEQALAKQVSVNRRLLEQALALDQRLNQKLTHDKSIYQNQ